MRFLVTRPQPDCHRTADALRAAHHRADEAPLLTFSARPPEQFDLTNVTAMAISSRRTVSVLRGHAQFADLARLAVYTVGDSTAEASRAAGFSTVRSASGNVAALAQLIAEDPQTVGSGSILYPAARDRAGDLEGLLQARGISCRVCPVYAMMPAQALPGEVSRALAGGLYDGVLIFSRRTAATFSKLLGAAGLDHILPRLRVYALSEQAGAPLASLTQVEVAEFPAEKALLELVLGES